MKVLFVDDDREDYELFHEALMRLVPGATCAWAQTCADALALLDPENPPDYIFLDSLIGTEGPTDCLAAIRKNRKFDQTSITIYSSQIPFYNREQSGKPANANVRFLSKPVSLSNLEENLRAVLRI